MTSRPRQGGEKIEGSMTNVIAMKTKYYFNAQVKHRYIIPIKG